MTRTGQASTGASSTESISELDAPVVVPVARPIARVLPLLEPAHLDRDFDYLVPPEFDEIAQPGVRVRLRFSGRLIDGYLLERRETSDHTGKLVRLERVISPEQVLTPEILRLVTAVAARYAGTRADVLRLAIPPRHAKVETEGTEKPARATKSKKKPAVAAAGVVDLDEDTLADTPGSASPDIDSATSGAAPVTAPDIRSDSTNPAAVQSNPAMAALTEPREAGATQPAAPTRAAAPPASATSQTIAGTDQLRTGPATADAAAADQVVEPAVAQTGADGAGREDVRSAAVPQSTEPTVPQQRTEGAGAESRSVDPAVSNSRSAQDVSVVDHSSSSENADGRGVMAADAPGDVAVVPQRGAAGAGIESRSVGPAVSNSRSAQDVSAVDRSSSSEDADGGGVMAADVSGDVAVVPQQGTEGAGVESRSVGPAVSNSRSAQDVSVVSSSPSSEDADGGDGAAADVPGDVAVSTESSGDGGAGADAEISAGGRSADASAPTAEEVLAQAVVVDYPAWGRYLHGHSFLTALALGRGPRAGWQALPGEDWAARLAELAAVTVRGGRSAVIMVPDQRDLDRVLKECVALVGESAVGLAAGLGPAARYRRWLAALRGTARVVVGTRSSVFAPVKDLGLLAIWDDGDDTFAEPRSPYPHAREVAMLRAHETGAAFVAGGFSRTAEVQAIVESGWAHDLLADRTVLRHVMPRITAPGDTDAALERDPIAQAIRIPAVAFMEARKAIKEGGPVLVQVPRRGYIPALACAKCRTPARCRHCNGPLSLPDNNSGGPLRSGREGVAEAHSPSCRWCGITEAAFRCGSCGSRALRAVVIGAARTAEELGRAFPGVPVRGSGGSSILDTVPEGPQVVVSTIGAEPRVPGGYAVAMLLDGWALLGRADLRAAEDALRRWMSAAALVRPGGRVIVMADAGIPTVQALVRWDPVWHAAFELGERTEVRFPPAVRFVALDGTTESIAELLAEAKLPAEVEVLGPVPLPPGARKPFSSGDSPAEVERMILRVDRSHGSALSRALTIAQAVRSTHRSDAPLRVQIDPIDIG